MLTVAVRVPAACPFHPDGSNDMNGGTIYRGLRKPTRDAEMQRHQGPATVGAPEGAENGVPGAC